MNAATPQKVTNAGSIPRVLSIAGTDPTGGAGIQADLKAITAAGGFGMSVVTSLVAQNTQGVRTVHTPPLEFLEQQLAAVFDDVEVDAIKIGMLASKELIETVTAWLKKVDVPVVVLDPVMIATSGDRLQSADSLDAMRKMLAYVDVVTPNAPELALLGGTSQPSSMEEAVEQSLVIAEKYGVSVIAKGGHLDDSDAGNAVVTPEGTVSFVSCPRVQTSNTHGTGCSLSSALATRIAAGEDLQKALTWSTRWLRDSIVAADRLQVGKGNGPVDHSHRNRYMARAAQVDSIELPAVFVSSKGHVDLKPHLPAAGPFTQALWDSASGLINHALSTEFIARICDGTLDDQDFRFYMEQDAWFMDRAFGILSILSAKAPTPQAQVIWSSAAQNSIVIENDAHLASLGIKPEEVRQIVPTPITAGLVDFLRANVAINPYVVGAASALAGYWIYAEAASRVTVCECADHPFRVWAAAYSDEEFLETVELVMKATEEALAQSSELDVMNAGQAFTQACNHELKFLDQTYRWW